MESQTELLSSLKKDAGKKATEVPIKTALTAWALFFGATQFIGIRSTELHIFRMSAYRGIKTGYDHGGGGRLQRRCWCIELGWGGLLDNFNRLKL